MKTIISIILAVVALPLFAADPVVVIKSAGEVTIDGKSAGSVVDVLANNPDLPNLRARLLDAWLAREAGLVGALDAAKADAAASKAQLSDVVAALKSISFGVPLPAVVAKAIVTEDEQRKTDLLAQKAAIEAELSKVQ